MNDFEKARQDMLNAQTDEERAAALKLLQQALNRVRKRVKV